MTLQKDPIAMTTPQALAASCDDYLRARTATYEQRCERFSAAHHIMEMHGHLTDDDILLDFGAGSTDLDRYLREQGWSGRYWPVDGWMGYDLNWWKPKRNPDWIACLEVIEHLPMMVADRILAEFKEWSTKGVVLTTPNADTVDVLAMDATHRWGCYPHDLTTRGYQVVVCSLYGQTDDSILAWWSP